MIKMLNIFHSITLHIILQFYNSLNKFLQNRSDKCINKIHKFKYFFYIIYYIHFARIYIFINFHKIFFRCESSIS